MPAPASTTAVDVSHAAPPGRLGHVTIAGAGPGDPELLTLKVHRLLHEADAIVHDALVSEAIRACFGPRARRYAVGKRAGDPASTPQAEINALLVRLARDGRSVLRLKGGDPLVFGRGGEEAAHLRAAGIPCEIVPGISAAQGAAAGAGIPLTHRGASRACVLLDGHGPHLASIDWAALVRLGGTWAFYMATHSVQAIAARLLAAGAAPDLPLALVEAASLPAQRVIVRTCAQAAAGELPPPGAQPGLVLVGPTVAVLGAADLPAFLESLDVCAVPDLSRPAGATGADRRWR